MFDYIRRNQDDASCNNCIYKNNDCGMWEDKKETFDTGYDKNDLAKHCYEYRE